MGIFFNRRNRQSKLGRAIRSRAELEKERNELTEEERVSLTKENKKSKKTCIWILVLFLPTLALSILGTVSMFKDNFLYLFLVLGVWIFNSIMLQNARSDSKPVLGVREVMLMKITNLLMLVWAGLAVGGAMIGLFA